MAVPVDETGHDDHAAQLDDDRVAVGRRIGEVGADCLYPLAPDENVALIEVSDRWIDGDDRRAA